MKVLSIISAFVLLSFMPALSNVTPYQITNCIELQQMSNDVAGHYVLMNDIDCADSEYWNNGKGFDPIGSANQSAFKGTFDGQYHIIKNLHINRPGEDHIGLFGVAGGSGEIKNVGLIKVKIIGNNHVGSLGGAFIGSASVSECFASIGIVIGNNNCGGLIGTLNYDNPVGNAYASVNVCATIDAGGLAGYNNGSEISNSYASGDVFSSGKVGGLVGRDELGHETYINCFSVGRVFCYGNPDQQLMGGLLGHSHGAPTINNSYWLDHKYDCADRCVGDYDLECDANAKHNICYFMRSDNEPMKSWDFTDTWGIREGRTLPFLKWQKKSSKKSYFKRRRCSRKRP